MNLRDFRIGWRVLVKEPGYSTVVIAGLALGFAACILLLGFVAYSFSYDSNVPDNERVYVLKHRLNFIPAPQWIETMPFGFRDTVLAGGMAQAATVVAPRRATLTLDGHKREIEVTVADPDFASIFGVQAIQGDLQAALSRPEGMAITRQAAAKLFGSGDVFGRQVVVDDKLLTVMALLPDPPDNTTVDYGALIGMRSLLRSPQEQAPNLMATWMSLGGRMYVRLRPGITPAMLHAQLQAAADQSPWQQIPEARRFPHVFEVALGTLHDAYFDATVAGAYRSGPRGDRQAVLGLAGIAMLILLLAMANFVNLATVRVMRRRREIGMRKVLGASSARVVSQFVAESLLVASMAALIGLLLAWLLLPMMAALVDRRLDNLFGPITLLATLAGAMLTGVCASAYPAWVALRMHPSAALSGRGSAETSGGLAVRRALTVMQFAGATGLCAMTLSVAWQSDYALRLEPGFDPTPILLIDLPLQTKPDAILSWSATLARLPGVTGVAGSSRAIGDLGMKGVRWTTELRRPGQRLLPLLTFKVSPNFLAMYHIAPIAGKLFDPALAFETQKEYVLLSAHAVQAFGFASPQAAIGQPLDGDENVTIIGVLPEVRNQSLHEALEPTVYQVGEGDIQVISVRYSGDRAVLSDAIATQWEQHFAGKPMVIRAAPTVIAAQYVDDLRLAKLMAAASLVAVVLAAFGIYVLAAYTVQRRYREIALRKLHGAGGRAIAGLIAREFGLLLGAGALLGLPVALLTIERYLSTFVERAPMGQLPVAAALLLTLAVALGASLRHARVAMQLAPARVLRDQ